MIIEKEESERAVSKGVEINIPSFLRHLTDSTARSYVVGGTIGACLAQLVGLYPRLGPRLFRAEGELSHDLNLYLNGVQVNPDELSRPVKEGDKLYIAHVIIGG